MHRIDPRRALATAAVPVVLLLAACAPSTGSAPTHGGPTRSAVEPAAPSTRVFVSSRYHFRVRLPEGWSGTDARSAWDGKALQGTQSPAFADFTDSRTNRVFTIGAAPPSTGLHLTAWRAAMLRGAAPGCVDAASATAAALGGEPALTWSANCPELHPVKFAVVHRGIDYAAIFEPSGSVMSVEDLRVFDAIRRSFRFTD